MNSAVKTFAALVLAWLAVSAPTASAARAPAATTRPGAARRRRGGGRASPAVRAAHQQDGTKTAHSWTNISSFVHQSSGGAITIELASRFSCDYNNSKEITIPGNTDVSILGAGNVLDAFRNGRLFTVNANAILALSNVTLQNGYVAVDSVSFPQSCRADLLNPGARDFELLH
jgi:hypothetical protein